MTLMPSRHVRDPRRRYRANFVRKRIKPSVPPPVVVQVSATLIAELIRVDARTRTRFLQRIEAEKGSQYAAAILSVLADALREKRSS